MKRQLGYPTKGYFSGRKSPGTGLDPLLNPARPDKEADAGGSNVNPYSKALGLTGYSPLDINLRHTNL